MSSPKLLRFALPLIGASLACGQPSVTDFSGWSESGNLLAGSGNELEQDFITSGADISPTYNSHTGTAIGQESFLTDEFATLTAGDRISVELDAFGPGVNQTVGLAVASTQTPAIRENLFCWLFKHNGNAQLFSFDGTPAYGTQNNIPIAADTDTLFIEKSPVGWSFGGITTADVETYYLRNVTSVGGVDLTADGSAVGVWSDLRTVGGSSTLTNFTLQENEADVSVLFADDFSGPGAADLDGTTPDTTTGGATWTASSLFDANGDANVTDAANGSATLPFTPVNGFVYTLEVSFGDLITTPNPNNNNDESWLGLGFGKGQSSSSGNGFRFINESIVGDGVIGKAWTFNRGSGASGAFDNEAYLGNGSGTSNPGLADGESWTTDATTFGGNLDLRIVMDTTAGAGGWTATWLADTGSGFAVIRATTPLLDEDIDSVGVAASAGFVAGTIESFFLTSVAASELPDIIDISFDVAGNVVLTLDGPAAGLTAQRSDDLSGFVDVASTAAASTLTIDAADVDPNADGADFFRVRN